MPRDRGGILVSCSFVSPWLSVELPSRWEARPRPSDYGVGTARAALRRLREVVRLVLLARRQSALVVSTASLELLLLAALRPLLGPCVLVAYDPLQPSGSLGRRLMKLLSKRIDLVMCIRSAEVQAWRTARQAEFVPFLAPEPARGPLAASNEPAKVYAAGDAHRDYELLMAATAGTSLPVLVCTRQPLNTRDSTNIVVNGPVSPEKGRVNQQSSGITAVLLTDTSLPAGPLVLLDAMAVGAAVVCSHSPGLIDYVEDDVDAIVLPRGATPDDLRCVLERLAGDRGLRERLGTAARQRLAEDLHASRTLARCVQLIGYALAHSRSPEIGLEG